jgi:hypothetical protein
MAKEAPGLQGQFQDGEGTETEAMMRDIPGVLDWVKSVFDKADKYLVVCEIVLNKPFDQSSSIPYMADRMFISDYDNLCVKLFELDIGGWVVINVSSGVDCLDWEKPPLETITITMSQEIV